MSEKKDMKEKKKRSYYTADSYKTSWWKKRDKSHEAGFLVDFYFKPEEAINLAAAILNRLAENPTHAVQLSLRTNKKRFVLG